MFDWLNLDLPWWLGAGWTAVWSVGPSYIFYRLGRSGGFEKGQKAASDAELSYDNLVPSAEEPSAGSASHPEKNLKTDTVEEACAMPADTGNLLSMTQPAAHAAQTQNLVRDRLRTTGQDGGEVTADALLAGLPPQAVRSVLSDLYLLKFKRVITWDDNELRRDSRIRILRQVPRAKR